MSEEMTMQEVEGQLDDYNPQQMAWNRLVELKEAKTPFEVEVAGVVKGGVIAYVEDIRAFIPASKLALGYVEDLNTYLNKKIMVQVLDVIPEDKRLLLSAKELLQAEARKARKARINSVEVGTVMEGEVETIKEYGAFVRLEGGMSGLLHVSQISEKRIKTPDAVLSVGDKVTVKVIAVKDGKLSLSIKALTAPVEEEKKEAPDTYQLPKSEEIGTSLGSLFANLKL